MLNGPPSPAGLSQEHTSSYQTAEVSVPCAGQRSALSILLIKLAFVETEALGYMESRKVTGLSLRADF